MAITHKKTIFFIIFLTILSITLSSIGNGINLHPLSQQSSELETYHYTFNSSGYTLIGEIYLPQNITEKLPGIVFCEGLAGYIDAYKWLAKTIARQGYIVTIFDFPGQGHSEGIFQNIALEIPILNLYIRYLSVIEFPYHYLKNQWITATKDALTYLVEESTVKQKVNETSIGLIGHSYGGITVTEVAAVDDRFDAVVALSQGNVLSVNKINIPIQFQGGCFDLGTISIPILNRCYKKANTPKQLIAIKHGTHFGFSTAFGPFCPCPKKQKEIVATYATGWFDYYLKNDLNAFNTITSSMDGLSSIIPSRYNFGNGDIILT